MEFKDHILKQVLHILTKKELRHGVKMILFNEESREPSAEPVIDIAGEKDMIAVLIQVVERLLILIDAFPKDKISLEILQQLNIYIPLKTFIQLIQFLISHGNIILRRKALQMLNDKVEERKKKISPGNVELILAMIPTMSKVIGSYNFVSGEALMNIQAALMTSEILCKRFASDKPQVFIQLFNCIIEVVVQQHKQQHDFLLIGTFAVILNSFVVAMPQKLIPYLASYMPIMFDLFKRLHVDENLRRMFFVGTIITLNNILVYQGAFLNPYLSSILDVIIEIAPLKKAETISQKKIDEVTESFATHIEARICLPVLIKEFKVGQLNFLSQRIKYFEVLQKIGRVTSQEVIANNHAPITAFYLKAFELSIDYEDVALDEAIYRCLSEYLLKMNGQMFQPFLQDIVQWSSSQTSQKHLLFFGNLLCYLFSQLKMIFNDFFPMVCEKLFQYIGDDKMLRELPMGVECWRRLLRALATSLQYEQQVGDEYFGKITSLLLLQYQNNFILKQKDYLANFISYVIPVVINLGRLQGAFISSNEPWKIFNEKLMLSCGTGTKSQKIVLLTTICAMFNEFSEEYLGLLPDILPTLSELLQDSNEEVESHAKQCATIIEKHLKEPIIKYLQ